MLNVSSDFLLVISAVFSSGWKIVTSFHIPGTNINVAEFIFGCMMVTFVIKALPYFLGFSSFFGSSDSRDTGGFPQNGTNRGDRSANRPSDVGRW